MFFMAQANPIVKFDPMGGIIDAIKLKNLHKGLDVSNLIK